MSFDKKLSYEEIAALSRVDKLNYIAWLEKEQKGEDDAEAMAVSDWKGAEFTLNNLAAARRDFALKEEQLPVIIGDRLQEGEEERFTFFWETKSPFSQWHPSGFEAPSYMWRNSFYENLVEKEGFPATFQFRSAEQYMMYCKAMLFIDTEVAGKIMSSVNPREIKDLGRKVRRFSEDTWYVFRWRFVYEGNKYKFTQSETLKEVLCATEGTTLVEASPYDRIWGIGLTKDDPKAHQRSTWEGKNLLGEILTELRIELMGHY